MQWDTISERPQRREELRTTVSEVNCKFLESLMQLVWQEGLSCRVLRATSQHRSRHLLLFWVVHSLGCMLTSEVLDRQTQLHSLRRLLIRLQAASCFTKHEHGKGRVFGNLSRVPICTHIHLVSSLSASSASGVFSISRCSCCFIVRNQCE